MPTPETARPPAPDLAVPKPTSAARSQQELPEAPSPQELAAAPTGLPRGPAMLFCPADRVDRFAKAAASADVVILDLEDGVAATDKDAARRHLAELPLDPERTIIRISPAGTAGHELDLAALAGTAYRTVMLAKAQQPADLRKLASSSYQVIVLCETALGILNAPALAADPAVTALMWGAEDLLVSLGGRSSRHPDGRYRSVALQARSQVLLAAGAFGKAAIDSVYLNIVDLPGLLTETQDAAESGFVAKACIHPSQVEVVRQGFAPTPVQLSRAQSILRAAEHAGGVFAFEGRMVDEPVLAQARRLLASQSGGVSPAPGSTTC